MIDFRRKNWPQLLVALAVMAVVLMVVRRCNRLPEAEQRATAAEQRTAAMAAGIPTLLPVKDLRPQLAHLEAENALLKEALARARRAVPGAKPSAVVRTSTGPVVATGIPRPINGKPCLLAEGDSTELRVDEVFLETREGARMVVGSVSA